MAALDAAQLNDELQQACGGIEPEAGAQGHARSLAFGDDDGHTVLLLDLAAAEADVDYPRRLVEAVKA